MDEDELAELCAMDVVHDRRADFVRHFSWDPENVDELATLAAERGRLHILGHILLSGKKVNPPLIAPPYCSLETARFVTMVRPDALDDLLLFALTHGDRPAVLRAMTLGVKPVENFGWTRNCPKTSVARWGVAHLRWLRFVDRVRRRPALRRAFYGWLEVHAKGFYHPDAPGGKRQRRDFKADFE